MAQTIASMAGVIKDAWTSDTIQKQFYDDNPLLEKIRAAAGVTMIGLQAQVPIHSGRSGGYTSVAAAGGVLNPARNQTVAQATYTMVYHWFQVALEASVLNQTGTSSQAIIAGKDLEMKGAVQDMSKHASRQLARNGDSILAECATGGASTEVELRPSTATTAYHGYDAIVRGHLHADLPVDIGTTADTDSLVTGSYITAVEESPTTPSITIGSSISTTAGTHFVYLANPNSATLPNAEMNGLENMIGNTTFGGINPATAGNEYWKAAMVDTTTTSFSLDMALNLQRAVFQKGGRYQTSVFTSAKQMAAFYSTLQNQVRFTGEKGMGAGGVGGLEGLDWNGVGVNVLPDIYDADWFHLMLEDLVRVEGSWKKPMWATDIQGSGGDMSWAQGTTGFQNAVCWPFTIGMQRRNRSAAAINLVS
jgi:hypothetical protein